MFNHQIRSLENKVRSMEGSSSDQSFKEINNLINNISNRLDNMEAVHSDLLKRLDELELRIEKR